MFLEDKDGMQEEDLESLVGKLQHACKVVKHGRTFMRRMFELLSLGRKQHHFLRLNCEFRSDLAWWDTFLSVFNGTSFMDHLCPRQPTHHAYTDASGLVGCGGVWLHQWFMLKWDLSYQDQPISQKELLAVVLACAVWGKEWANEVVLVHCDNTAAVEVVNSGYILKGYSNDEITQMFILY